MLTAISIYSYFEKYKEYKYWSIFVKITLVFIGITGIMTIISSTIDPMYSRMMTQSSSGYSNTIQGEMLKRLGGGLYSYGQSIVLLLPGLVYFYKQIGISKRNKYVILLLIVLIYFVILKMQFFANILTASIVILLAILGRKRMDFSIAFLLILMIVLIAIPTHSYSNVFSFFADLFETDSQNHYKITDMSEFLTSGEIGDQTATGSRAYRYVSLFDNFKKNPIFGFLSYSNTGLNLAGFHLHFMWKLTLYGLVMFVNYMFIHFLFIKIQLRDLYRNPYAFYFIIAISGYFILGSMKTIVGRDFWITYFVLLPGFKYLVNKPFIN